MRSPSPPARRNPLVCDGRARARLDRLLQRLAGRFKLRRVRGDLDGEKTGARGALRCSLMAEIDDIRLGTADDDKTIGVPDRDFAAMLGEQAFE